MYLLPLQASLGQKYIKTNYVQNCLTEANISKEPLNILDVYNQDYNGCLVDMAVHVPLYPFIENVWKLEFDHASKYSFYWFQPHLQVCIMIS